MTEFLMYYISMLKALIYQHSRNIRYIKKNKKTHKSFCQRKPESVFIVTRWWKLLQSDTSKALIDSKEDNKICKGVDHFFVGSKQLISNMTHHPRKTGKMLVETIGKAPCLMASAGLRMSTGLSMSAPSVRRSWLMLT